MQIDPIEYNLLLHTLEKQQKELKRLKNQLDFEEPKVFSTKNHKDMDLNIHVEEWNCQHFIRYFLKKYKEAYGETYVMESSASFRLEAFKITNFWKRNKNLSKEQFKDFIDFLFETANENYKIKMGLITSDDQLKNYKNFVSKRSERVYNRIEDTKIENLPKSQLSGEELKEKLKKSLGKEEVNKNEKSKK